MREIIDFTLKDAKGVDHKYMVTLHPASEGQALYWTLMSSAAEPLMSIAATIAKSPDFIAKFLDGAKDGLEKAIDQEGGLDQILTFFASLDLKSVASDLKHAVSAIDMSKFAPSLLKYTFRDKKPLENEINFDDAYTGNYLELTAAMWKVVEANGFLVMPGISGLGKNLAEGEEQTPLLKTR